MASCTALDNGNGDELQLDITADSDQVGYDDFCPVCFSVDCVRDPADCEQDVRILSK